MGFIRNSYGIDLVRGFSGHTDKLIVGPLLGLSVLGNYHLGIQFLVIAALVPNIVMQYTLPSDSSGQSNVKLKKLSMLHKKSLILNA